MSAALHDQVSFTEVERAASRLANVAHRTPVMTSRTLNALCGCEVLLKCENFQRVGAFKFRGAYNALSQLDEEQRRRGVITFSSGNHAQAVALAGKLLGVPATIVMPSDAPRVKYEATRGYGASVVCYDPTTDERERLTRSIAAERNLLLIPPYDDPRIVAGQATAAKELFEQAGQLDALLVPCGGGGLLSGSAISASALSPRCCVMGVEPEAGDDGKRSFETGVLQRVEHPDTIADGARTASLGNLTFALIRQHVHAMLSVPDTALIQTMRFLWGRMKLVVEPTGALGLAPLLTKQLELKEQRVGVIVSGGNAQIEQIAKLLAHDPARDEDNLVHGG